MGNSDKSDNSAITIKSYKRYEYRREEVKIQKFRDEKVKNSNACSHDERGEGEQENIWKKQGEGFAIWFHSIVSAQRFEL
jgi:hypothetical protein